MMKLRYFIPVLAAVIALFTGCKSDEDPIYLDNIQVSKSFVGISTDGSATKIKLNAGGDWAFDKVDARTTTDADGKKVTTYYETPEWLTVSPLSGTAGQDLELTFSATEATATRTAVLKLSCGGSTQEINVMQYAQEAEPEIITTAQAVAMIKAGTQPASAVYVKGIVCRIQEISPSYGNATFFISDDGTYGDSNWLEIYRGKWINGANFTTGDEFAVGDEMVVKGVLIDYNGTPETSQGTAEVISLTKSLIKVDSLDVKQLPVEGGIVNAALTCKGNGISVDIPAEAQSWLSITGIDTENAVVKFFAQPNSGGDRSATITFKTTSAGKDYSATTTIAQKGAIQEVSVADFLDAAVGDAQYRVTGIITKVVNSAYGNVNIRDFSGEVYVYGIGAKGDFEKAGLKAGDIVTLVGKRGEHKGSAQMAGAQLESVKAVTEVSIADFLTKDDKADVYYKVTGTIDEIANSTYGNLYLSDGTTRLYVYGCYPGWGATGDFRKNYLATAGIAVGDKLTVIGVKSTYNGTPQVNGGLYFDHEKKAE